jgi:hypothetical protein
MAKRPKGATRATHTKSAEIAATAPAVEPTLQFRGRAPVQAPAETPMETLQRAIGPNVDGLAHLTILAHATDDEERALLAAELEARVPNAAPNVTEG